MALQAIIQLANQGVLAGVAYPANNADLKAELEHMFGPNNPILCSLQKEKFTSQSIFWLNQIQANYLFVMTFPWKFQPELINLYANSFYNFHYGLLPDNRGADPVFESIRSGHTETGITVHQVTTEIDKGPILAVQKLPLDDKITHGWLCTSLAMVGAQICNALVSFLSKETKPALEPQPANQGKYFARPVLKDVTIDWEKMSGKQIHSLVRACNPWNKGAYTFCNGWNFRIVSTTLLTTKAQSAQLPGTIHHIDRSHGVEIVTQNNELIKINIFYCDEGFFNGAQLIEFGLKKGDRLFQPHPTQSSSITEVEAHIR
jgi:methionyl-tRNA formyltransferase